MAFAQLRLTDGFLNGLAHSVVAEHCPLASADDDSDAATRMIEVKHTAVGVLSPVMLGADTECLPVGYSGGLEQG